ncbi:MAG: class I SAM-dependent methyltransferase [Thermoanaerobaculia bacterium]
MKRYDRAYFDRWYRDPETSVIDDDAVRRRATMVLAVAEHLLRRPVRSLLDIGCGEGNWEPHLRRIQPGIRYLGIDSSRYAIRRFGRERNLRLGSFADASTRIGAARFDVLVCSDVLHYLTAREIDRGLPPLVDRVDGIAYLSAYTSDDDTSGDLEGGYRRPASWYRDRFRRVGLTELGLQCWAGPLMQESGAALEYSPE